jgi:hypothetical protein
MPGVPGVWRHLPEKPKPEPPTEVELLEAILETELLILERLSPPKPAVSITLTPGTPVPNQGATSG